MKTVNTLFYGLFIAILVSIAGLFLASLLPIPGQIELKIVKSGSMEPSIMTGSLIVVQPVATYLAGDVITFGQDTRDQIPTTHRITALRQEGSDILYETKGDANEERDAYEVPRKEIIGKVLFSIPYLGYILDFARQPIGFTFMIGIPAGIVIIDEILRIVAEVRRLRTRNTTRRLPPNSDNSPPPDSAVAHTKSDNRILALQHTFRELKEAQKKRTKDGALGHRVTVTALVAMLCVSSFASASGTFGSTVSYFRDIDTSRMNLLAAIGLDFLVTPQNETSAILTEGSSLFIPIVTPELGSGPLMYRVTSQQTGGSPAFCNALTLNATTSPFIYSGTLSGLTTTSTTTTGVWTIAIGLPSASGLTDGDVCLIDLVYRGWHKDAPENTGYTDEERVSFSFTLSNPVLSPLIVLPEVPLTPQIEEPTNAGSTDEAAPPPLEEPPASEIQPPQEENVQPPPEI